MAYTTPTDAETSRQFLAELHRNGMLWHPEETAAECLLDVTAGEAADLDSKMAATFQFLTDPCVDALALINSAA